MSDLDFLSPDNRESPHYTCGIDIENLHRQVETLEKLAFALANDWATKEGIGQIPDDLFKQLIELNWEFKDTWHERNAYGDEE